MDALPHAAPLQDGTFTIEGVLDHSQFSLTYTARDLKLQRLIALKEYFPFGSRRAPDGKVLAAEASLERSFESGRERFLEEARVLAQFHHPSIVAVHSFFEENNTAYMAMELLQGRTLQQQQEERGQLSEPELVHLAEQAGTALETVHASGLLHRDLKPANIFACDDGRIVLLDFGLSTRIATDDYGTRALDETIRFGTPGYAPLEQYTQSQAQYEATDVYGFGAALYHLLTGTAPVPAADRAFGVPLPSPREIVGANAAISGALMWSLQMRPEDRPQSVREFLERLTGRDGVTSLRLSLLRVLQARCQQLQQRDPQRSPHPSTSTARRSSRPQTTVLPPGQARSSQLPKPSSATPEPDNSGCFRVAFLTYLIGWILALAIWSVWFVMRFVLSGG